MIELFEKGISIVAFGGYVHSEYKATISLHMDYCYEEQSYYFDNRFEFTIEQNEWKNIGFHAEQTLNKDSTVNNVNVKMTIVSNKGNVLNFIGFDLDVISKDEFLDTTCAVSFYQKTNMHVPYLYYLKTDLSIKKYLLDRYKFDKGRPVVLKSCNRCGRYLPINIENEMKTLSFSLHCKKCAPCIHSTFRAYKIENYTEELSKNFSLSNISIEENKIFSYHGHQLECKACKKFFVNAPLNPQRNPQQFKEDGLRRRAIEVLINKLLNKNLVHFEFEKRTKKEFSKYIWEKFDRRCFKCGPESETISWRDMALDHTLPLAYLYRLDETATCLCSES